MSLVGYIADQGSRGLFRTSWLGGEYVLVGEYMSCSQYLFESGTVLGWTFHDKMRVFAQLLSEPGREAEVLTFLAQKAAERLAQSGQEPSNFWDLYAKPEVTKRFGDPSNLVTNARIRVRLKDVDIRSQLALTVMEGIGFGSTYPSLAERLLGWRFDEAQWAEARSHGLAVSSVPPNHTPLERQAQMVSLIRPYIAKVSPSLLTPLGL